MLGDDPKPRPISSNVPGEDSNATLKGLVILLPIVLVYFAPVTLKMATQSVDDVVHRDRTSHS